MFALMRKHSQSFIIYALFAVIIAVFVVSFGPNSGGCNTDVPYAARVNGEIISEDDFKREYQSQVQRIMQGNPGFDQKLLAQLGIKKQVLDQLIEGRLLKQAAEHAGFVVGDKELQDFIVKAPAFQVKGQFDYKAYERYVNYSIGTSAARFEAQLKDQLLASKYRDAVEAATAISNEELWQQYQDENDKANLYFVAFKDNEVQATPPTAAEVDAYANDHGSDIEARYKRDTAKYHESKKWKARHILVKVSQNAGPEEVKKAEARIQDIAKQLATADFSELAKKYSEDSSKDKGGDVGYFSSGMMVKAFEEAADNLKVGETSPPVRSPFGFHLIRLDDVKEGANHELSEVQSKIAGQLLTEERQKAGNQKRAEALLASLRGGKSITELAQPEEADAKAKKPVKPDLRPVYKTTGLFARTASVPPKIGFVDGLMPDAFALTSAHPAASRVYRSGDRLFVVVLKERQVADRKKFDAERKDLLSAALTKKQTEVVRAFVEARRKASAVSVNERLLGDDAKGTTELD